MVRFKKTMKSSSDYAQLLDEQDNLKEFRSLFYIPKKNGKECTYFCGHSLGLQPKKTKDFVNQELNDWKEMGVLGHFDAKNPWYYYHEYLNKQIANLVGALDKEVVSMNSLTANLHLLLTSFYRPDENKYKIIIDTPCFPSDRYALNSHMKLHNLDPKNSLIELKGNNETGILKDEQIINTIEENASQVKLILISPVNYYTGQYYDIEKISKVAKKNNCIIGLDLAHTIGNVKIFLHDWDIDFAVWCSYKYLNGGPGAPGGAFIHSNHLKTKTLNRLEGWWGHDKNTRFELLDNFISSDTAESWQLSNPPILSMAALWSSLNIFENIGIDRITTKSIKMTSYLYTLLSKIDNLTIITPSRTEQRGAQISIKIHDFDKKIYETLLENGYICDYRKPDVLRIAPAPLYNTFKEVYNFSTFLNSLINE